MGTHHSEGTMEQNNMHTIRTAGWLMIAGAVGVFIPYTILTITFGYPDILREPAGTVLLNFHKGGSQLIFTWLAFALMGLPLLIAYSLIGRLLEMRLPFVRWATTIGIISGLAQIIGLLRWVFVVPVLASDFISTASIARKEAIEVALNLIHQFAGVLLGEHIGQLFTNIWTTSMAIALFRVGLISNWLKQLGIISALIDLLGQSELLNTVISEFPVVPMAGFVGSTLWLVWLLLLGITLVRIPITNKLTTY